LRLRGGGKEEDEEENEKEPASSSSMAPPPLPKAPAAKKKPQREDAPKTDLTKLTEILQQPKKGVGVGAKVVIKTGDRWRVMEVTALNKDKTLQATEVATGATREELDVWTAVDRLRTLEEDSKDAQIGKAEKKKYAEAHLERLKVDMGKKKDVENTRVRVTEIKEKPQAKKFILSEIKVRSEKEEVKLAEANKLLEVATAKEKRAEEALIEWEKVVERRRKELDKLIRELEKKQEKEVEKRMKKKREKEKTMAGWYAMTQDEERQELDKERGGERYMRVAMLSSIAERVKEVSEGLLKDQTIDDITKMVKSMPTADEFSAS
jgi:hypothetical protein